MSCPLWGDGSLWGDGDNWCRDFGSSPYVTEVDRNIHRVSVKINYTGAVEFRVDEVRPRVDWGRSLQDWTYAANIDLHLLSRMSVRVNYSTAASFVVYTVIPEVSLKKHQPRE